MSVSSIPATISQHKVGILLNSCNSHLLVGGAPCKTVHSNVCKSVHYTCVQSLQKFLWSGCGLTKNLHTFQSHISIWFFKHTEKWKWKSTSPATHFWWKRLVMCMKSLMLNPVTYCNMSTISNGTQIVKFKCMNTIMVLHLFTPQS